MDLPVREGIRSNYHQSYKIYKYIKESDMDALDKHMKETVERSTMDLGVDLCNRLDEYILYGLCLLDQSHLKTLEDRFPGCVSKIPYKAAVMSGNLSVLEANKELYAKADEKEIRMTYEDRDQFLRLHHEDNGIFDHKLLCRIYRSSRWLQTNGLKLPDIEFLDYECSKILLKMSSEAPFAFGVKRADGMKNALHGVVEISYKLRQMYGANVLMVHDVDDIITVFTGMKQGTIPIYDFKEYVCSLRSFGLSQIMSLIDVFHENDISFEKLKLRALNSIRPEWICSQWLYHIGEDDERQKLLIEYFTGVGMGQFLYEAARLHPEETSRFRIIYEWYYSTNAAQDEYIS